jgi:hypothetical protein
MKKSGSQKSKSPSQLIDARIRELDDWRGQMLGRLRTLVKEADPEVVEEWPESKRKSSMIPVVKAKLLEGKRGLIVGIAKLGDAMRGKDPR